MKSGQLISHTLQINVAYFQKYTRIEAGRTVTCSSHCALPPSCADCLKIWYPKTPGTLRPFPGLQKDCFTLPIFVLQTFLTLRARI